MVQSSGSGRIPAWLVAAGGVVLGLALVAAFVATNLPPDAAEKMRASYDGGYAKGSGRAVRGAEVRRTPLTVEGVGGS